VAEVATALTARDEIDRTRTASPLYAAPDAVVIDTTGKSVQQVVIEVMGLIQGKVKSKK
jgi:cytidylate kinase